MRFEQLCVWQTRQVDFFHHSPAASEWRVLLTYLEYMEEAGERLENVNSVLNYSFIPG